MSYREFVPKMLALGGGLEGVPLLRLLAVAVTSAAALALGVLAVRLRSKPRRARRVVAVTLVAIVMVLGLLAPSLFRPAVEGQEVLIGGQEVLIGQRFTHYARDLTVDGVECGELCVAKLTGDYACGLRLDPYASLIGRRGTVYAATDPGYTCIPERDQYPHRAKAIDLFFDVNGNGFVDLLDVRGSDEAVAILIGSPQWWPGPDRYALIDPYTDQPGRWAEAAVGLVKLLLLALAGAAGAAVSKMVPKMVLVIKRRGQVPDLPPAGVVDPDTAKRALSGLVRSDRPGRPDASE